jgi:hypothetical protein
MYANMPYCHTMLTTRRKLIVKIILSLKEHKEEDACRAVSEV